MCSALYAREGICVVCVQKMRNLCENKTGLAALQGKIGCTKT